MATFFILIYFILFYSNPPSTCARSADGLADIKES